MRIWLSWSSGKDSAWALHTLRRDPNIEVVGLLTTLNEAAGRVAMHAVREELLDAQAAAAGLPLYKVWLPWPCSNADYEAAMTEAMARARSDGIEGIAFGDLFLEDVRKYREDKMAGTGMATLFPLWGADTLALARQMVKGGLRAHVTCVDPEQLDPAFVGRTFDHGLLADLPEGVDPCGENGEMHTFVFDGPMFDRPVPCHVGDILERDGFSFADVLPGAGH